MAIDPANPFDLRFDVTPAQDRRRLDLFIKSVIPSMSRTRIQRRIGEGRVEVNGKVRPANWRVLVADRVLVRCVVPGEGVDAGRRIPLDVIHEDGDIVVVNKQPGLVVHPVGKHRHDTLLNALHWRYADESGEGGAVSLANRLDQYTSGVVLAARHAAAKRVIQEDFERRVPEKTYLALCRGVVADDEGVIDLPIGPAGLGRDHCRMAVRRDEQGKESRTHFRVEERFPQGFTLVRLNPITGRQHQLRVHMSAIGHPLAADSRYGGGWRVALGGEGVAGALLERYALHAAELVFRHPSSGERMRCVAPLARDLSETLAALRRGEREAAADFGAGNPDGGPE